MLTTRVGLKKELTMWIILQATLNNHGVLAKVRSLGFAIWVTKSINPDVN